VVYPIVKRAGHEAMLLSFGSNIYFTNIYPFPPCFLFLDDVDMHKANLFANCDAIQMLVPCDEVVKWLSCFSSMGILPVIFEGSSYGDLGRAWMKTLRKTCVTTTTGHGH
jgi:hypothetical protein